MTKKSNKGEGYNKGDIYEDKITKKIISCKKKGPRNIGPFNLIK